MNEFYSGQEIWIVDRNENDISGVVFISKVEGNQGIIYAIVSPYCGYSSDIDTIMGNAIGDDFSLEFQVTLIDNCYATLEEATDNLKEES